jgi:hypothetical protein
VSQKSCVYVISRSRKASKARRQREDKTGGMLTTTSDLGNPRSGLIGTRSLVQVATHSHEPQGQQHHRDAGMISENFVLPTSGDVFEALLRRNSDILTDLPFSATNTVPCMHKQTSPTNLPLGKSNRLVIRTFTSL